MLAIALLHCGLDDFPAELAGSALALDFELHLVDLDLAERAELAVGVEEAAGGIFSGSEGDGDGVVGELVVVVVLPLSFFEEEDEGLAGFYAVDIIAGGFVMLAEEVIGLNNSLPLLLGLDLLGQLLLVAPAVRTTPQQGQHHKHHPKTGGSNTHPLITESLIYQYVNDIKSVMGVTDGVFNNMLVKCK